MLLLIFSTEFFLTEYAIDVYMKLDDNCAHIYLSLDAIDHIYIFKRYFPSHDYLSFLLTIVILLELYELIRANYL